MPVNSLLCDNYFVPNLEPYRYPKDLLEMLRSNVLPSETDASKTAIFLQDVEGELRRYDDELSRLRLVPEQLEIQRKELLKKADQHRSWLSPIRKLPVEVLQTIFLDVCLEDFFPGLVIQSVKSSDKTFCYAQAYELSCVSFHWKAIASGLPQLWSSLKVDVVELDTDTIPLLQLYLDNSRDQPLDMEIRCCVHGISLRRDNRSLKDRLGKYGLRILEILLQHTHRCGTFSFTLDIEGGESEFMDMVGSSALTLSMPKLHSLTTDLNDTHWTGRLFWESVRDNSPNLKVVRSVKLLGTDLIRYEKLNVLVVDDIEESTDQVFQVLKCCKNIRSLTMHKVFFEEDPGLSQPLELGALEELTVTFAGASDHIYPLFDNITTPSLKSLNISDGKCSFRADGVPRGVWSPASLATMLRRSGCAVRKLVLQVPDENILDSEFRKVLESCSTLTYLDVKLKRAMKGRETFIYWLFHKLHLPSTNGAFGQCLELLFIHEIGAQLDFQDALDILDTVESRSRISRSRSDDRIAVLQRVNIGLGRLVGNTVLQSSLEEQRQKLQREGTPVTILPFSSYD